MIVKSYIKRGNSFPIIIESTGKKYFVKLRAGMSGQYGLVAEWIGNKLGHQLNIKTQIPEWLVLDEGLIIGGIHIEVKELIHKSLGINIGFEYQEESEELSLDELGTLSRQRSNEIFMFDIMMINIDRTATNINLLKAKDQVFSIDYESSFLIQELIENKDLLSDSRILQCLRSNPLYSEIEDVVINTFIDKVNKISIEDIIREIPLSLLNEEQRQLIISGIEKKKKDKWRIEETISKLKDLKVETKEDMRIRINRNQANFKRVFNENKASNS